ncbi:MAG: NAD(+) synthase [Candidatus Humimicrobiaceae bacterium]
MESDQYLLSLNLDRIPQKIENFIRAYALSLNRDGAVVGLSGGLDSSLMLKLCASALGPKRVMAIILPERDSNKENIRDAINYAKKLRVKYLVKKITLPLWSIGAYNLFPPTFLFRKNVIENYVRRKKESISKRVGKDPFMVNLEGTNDKEMAKGIAYYRIKHRIRSAILFYYSELHNYLYVGAANKSEWLTGFFVKYGDSIADIQPILNVYKTQIFEIARHVGLPEHLIKKPPAPDLMPGLNDKDFIKLPYKSLDLILAGLENNYTYHHIAEIVNTSIGEVERVEKIMNKSEWLRLQPISLKI